MLPSASRPMPGRVVTLALSAALSGICPAVCADNGTILFSSGHATLIDDGGKTTRLTKGRRVGPGDLLRTGQGQVQLRFPDGTYASISPSSDLRIDAYHYSTRSGARNAALFTLYRGGVRFMLGAITGLPDGRFQLNTPFGTLHADAAEFSALTGAGLQVSVGAGTAQIRNQAGALHLAAGQRGFVRNASTPPLLVGTIVPAPLTPR